MMRIPTASKNSMISLRAARLPSPGMRSRPPKGSRTLLKTSLSARRCFRAEPAGHRLAGALEPADLTPDRERPVEQALLGACRRVEAGDDRGVDLLVHAGHARQERRPHLWERLGDTERVGEERDREPDVGTQQEHQPPVVVREREVEQHDVVRPVVRRLHLVDDGRHLEVVAVREHAALGRAGRPGRVDDRVEVVLGDARGRVVERGRIGCREVVPMGRQPLEVVVGENVAERRHLVPHRLHLRELLGVLADDRDRLRVLEEVSDVLRRARRVHRDPDGPDPRERKVDERPLETVAREERDVVALPHAAREQPVPVCADALVGLRPRDLAPAVVRLCEVCGRRAPGRDAVAPQLRDRPRAGCRRRF